MGVKTWAIGVLVLVLLAVGVTWTVQDWRYGGQLAKQASLHLADLDTISSAAATKTKVEQDKRLALEQRLSASEQTHYKELSDAQSNQARLRDRLASADLRLSVLLEDSASCNPVSATPGASGVVHGKARAKLDPAHAQRIIAITDEGDRGLIALQACQAYIRALGQ
nr:lysis system i-spanin subunit Rz [Pseudomonas sp. RGM2987]